jgi:hypothetical protein
MNNHQNYTIVISTIFVAAITISLVVPSTKILSSYTKAYGDYCPGDGPCFKNEKDYAKQVAKHKPKKGVHYDDEEDANAAKKHYPELFKTKHHNSNHDDDDNNNVEHHKKEEQPHVKHVRHYQGNSGAAAVRTSILANQSNTFQQTRPQQNNSITLSNLLVQDAIKSLQNNDNGGALTHLKLVGQQLSSSENRNSSSILTATVLIDDAIKEIQNRDIKGALQHLDIVNRQLQQNNK